MNASGNKLTAITRELWAQWHQTKACWKDALSQEFEQKYMEELLASVDRTVTVIDQLEKVITKVRKDCE
jgi:thymidylate synthase